MNIANHFDCALTAVLLTWGIGIYMGTIKYKVCIPVYRIVNAPLL